jgi:hypothetical protein
MVVGGKEKLVTANGSLASFGDDESVLELGGGDMIILKTIDVHTLK